MTRRAATSWAQIRSEKVPPDQEAAVAAGVEALRDALSLRELRSERGVTQVELAGRLGKSQGSISELERRDDVYLSSLREYVAALGGRLEVAAVFEDEGETSAKLIDLMTTLENAVTAARAFRAIDAARVDQAERSPAERRTAQSA